MGGIKLLWVKESSVSERVNVVLQTNFGNSKLLKILPDSFPLHPDLLDGQIFSNGPINISELILHNIGV